MIGLENGLERKKIIYVYMSCHVIPLTNLVIGGV